MYCCGLWCVHVHEHAHVCMRVCVCPCTQARMHVPCNESRELLPQSKAWWRIYLPTSLQNNFSLRMLMFL